MKKNLKIIEKKIEDALYALPLLPKAEKKIPDFVQNIIMVSGLAKINDLPRAKETSELKAKKELDAFVKKAVNLYQHINQMHKTSLSVFDKTNSLHPFLLNDDLKALIFIAGDKKRKILAVKNEARARKQQAKALTECLARIYTHLTGRRAARNIKNQTQETGKFNNFVKIIFEVLKVDASATSQVSARSKRMYKKTSKKIV